MDITYHYPPELLGLLIQTLPRLSRTKKDLVLFFRGAGVAAEYTADIEAALASDAKQISKYEIARRVLAKLNELGERALGVRRELLKRVTQFDDFSVCWDNDRLEAQGLVAQIQKVVNVKDAFTRMQAERDAEQSKRREQAEHEALRLRARERDLEAIKDDFFRLFAEANVWARGKALEGVLNRLFAHHGILVREAFTIRGDEGKGVVEQVDGVVELDGDLYLVEMKWWSEALGPGDVSQHMIRVFNRSQARGIFISASPFSEAALTVCKENLQRSVFVLCSLEELVRLLNERADLKAMLKTKIRAAIIEKQPFFRAW